MSKFEKITIPKTLALRLLENTQECIDQLEPFLTKEKYERRRKLYEQDIDCLKEWIRISDIYKDEIDKCPKERCKYWDNDSNSCNEIYYDDIGNEFPLCVLDERLENLCELK